MSSKFSPRALLFVSFLALTMGGLTGCASVPEDPAERAAYDEINDPLEPLNRGIFEFNYDVDKVILRPAAEVYRFLLPEEVRNRIGNVLNNLGEPVTFANNLLQGEVTKAGTTLGRFVVNSTAGVAGVFEVADDLDLREQSGDFGQTLNVWGVGEGPYLVLPLIGPSNPRDAIGYGVDAIMSPWSYIAAIDGRGTENRVTFSTLGATFLDRRSSSMDELDNLEKGSIDFYAQMRSVYRQYRNKQLGIETANEKPVFDDLYNDPSMAPKATAPAKDTKPVKKAKKHKAKAKAKPVEKKN